MTVHVAVTVVVSVISFKSQYAIIVKFRDMESSIRTKRQVFWSNKTSFDDCGRSRHTYSQELSTRIDGIKLVTLATKLTYCQWSTRPQSRHKATIQKITVGIPFQLVSRRRI